VTTLGVAHGLDGHRGVAALWAAELADNGATVLVEMHPLPHQRGAAAVGAAIAIGRQDSHAVAQEDALEPLDVGDARGGHNVSFRRAPPVSSRPATLAARATSAPCRPAIGIGLEAGSRG
jgi:hypothetical protein